MIRATYCQQCGAYLRPHEAHHCSVCPGCHGTGERPTGSASRADSFQLADCPMCKGTGYVRPKEQL